MSEIERRLEALERTNRRYRAGLTASLAALGVIALAGFGQVPPGQQQQQTFPRNIVADSITVQNLSAYTGTVNNFGTNQLTAQAATIGTAQCEAVSTKVATVADLQAATALIKQLASARILVKSASGADALSLMASSDGGTIAVMDGSGRSVGILSGHETGGLLQIGGKGGYTAFEAYADEKGGRIRTMNNLGKSLASFGRTDRGDGEIVSHTRNGNRAVVLKSNELGERGILVVQKEGGEPLVTIDSDDKGGFVQTLDGKTETSRLPSK